MTFLHIQYLILMRFSKTFQTLKIINPGCDRLFLRISLPRMYKQFMTVIESTNITFHLLKNFVTIIIVVKNLYEILRSYLIEVSYILEGLNKIEYLILKTNLYNNPAFQTSAFISNFYIHGIL